MTAILITATPPTPNGDLHLGHLSGPYLGADIYRRYAKQLGHQPIYICGSDDNQSYVATKASKTGASPENVARHFAKEIVDTLDAANIELDHFAQPLLSQSHRPMVSEFFKSLHHRGELVEKEADALWCDNCNRYLYAAYVTGRCPHCGASCDGNVCEACALPNQCTDMIDSHCNTCGSPAVVRPVRRLYLPLSRHRDALAKFYENVNMDSHLAAMCHKMLEDGLPDIPVSHPSKWGIGVEGKGLVGQCIYEWFEMAPGYLSATQEALDKRGGGSWKDIWLDKGSEIVQFFGYDNGYFHTVLFPAAYFAHHEDIRPPSTFVTNEFYQLNSSKFSTSRGNAIWGRDALRYVPADVIRFYLSYDRPEVAQSNFEFPPFRDAIEQQLVNSWDSWLLRLGESVRSRCQGKVPDVSACTAKQQRFLADLESLVQTVQKAYEPASFSPQRAARALCELVRMADQFGMAEEHWWWAKTTERQGRTAIALQLLAAKTLALLAAPLMPQFAAELWTALGLEGSPEQNGWERTPKPLPAGMTVKGLRQPWFADVLDRIDDLAWASAGQEPLEAVR